jgi:hypothetical protein
MQIETRIIKIMRGIMRANVVVVIGPISNENVLSIRICGKHVNG